MQKYKIFLFSLIATVLSVRANYVLNEPENSALADGHWVKIRVMENGVYGFSHERLRELGFENPEAVNVYGYDPTLLLDHDFVITPSDMNLLPSLHENGQMVFYAVGNVDFRAELWPAVSNSTTLARKSHSYSTGATYFLSDVIIENRAIPTIDAPSTTENMRIYSTHDALVYHEEDVYNPGDGSIWLCGPAMKIDDRLTYQVSINKFTGQGRLTYLGLISTYAAQSNNYFNVEYTGGIKASSLQGLKAKKINEDHVKYYPCMLHQTLQFPEDAPEPFKFDITFTPNPQIGEFDQDGGIDFWGLVYTRHNDLNDESKMLMYFNNTDSVALASFAGMDPDSNAWHLWNVSNFGEIKSHELLYTDEGAYAYLDQANVLHPNIIAAFRSDRPQSEPEVLGELAKQNLHALPVPDLVIVTTKSMLKGAEIAADFHREWQGLDVAIVDQQQIFNEYGSGNISPESLRRFFAHLYQRNPDKFKAILLFGTGTIMNAQNVCDESPTVVTSQMEYIYCEDLSKQSSNKSVVNKVTVNSCNDAFFGSFNKRVASTASYPVPYYEVISSGMYLPVGRLPFNDIAQVQAYYNKVKLYVGDRHSYPAAGNIILASDYATRSEDSHMANGEELFKAIPTDKSSLLTVTRVASNLYSTSDNNITRKVLLSALERGAGFYAFFGHGTSNLISGKSDFLTHISTVYSQNHPGRYPFMFIGSCLVGAFDRGNNLATAFIDNEFGGGIGAVASAREVFQSKNEELGKCIAKSYYNLKPGEWLGNAWKNGANDHIRSITSVDRILNTCAYNYIGDPAIPSFAPTHSIKLDDFDVIAAGGENTISGNVLNEHGETDDYFSGDILISIYDSPITIKNIAPGTNVVSRTRLDECEIDQELIGEYIGKVENGRFAVTFRGPRSGRPGTHRIQAYAYSSDDAYRALGVVSAQMVDADTLYEPATDALPSINDFIAGTGETDVYYTDAVELTATLDAPAGIADANALLNPVRLTIDGVAQTNIRRLLSPIGDNVFALSYRTNNLSGGRHSATLQVLDTNGNIAEASVEFSIDNAPKANLSVAITDDGANFEYAFNSSAVIKNAMLIVENLSGETIKYQPFENNSTSCNVNDLKSEAYRAYVQLDGDKVATATPKIEVIIN